VKNWLLIQEFQSTRSGAYYKVKLSTVGMLGCNCPGWTKHVKKRLIPLPPENALYSVEVKAGIARTREEHYRECKHTRWVEENLRQENGIIEIGGEVCIEI